MPELPEVETVVRQLKQRVVGKTVQRFTSRDKLVIHQSMKKLAPGKITNVERKGKYLLFHIGSQIILAHLRMTGHFSLDVKGGKYLAGTFHFTDGGCLNFHDIRRFGRLKLVSDIGKELQHIGPDPLEIDSSLFVERLQQHPQANIKSKLLDQSCISGIGNIYAQEALYHAKVHPKQKIGDVPAKALKNVFTQLQRILRLAIDHNGTTVHNYTTINGKGDFQQFLAVYGKENCPLGHTITRMVIQGRGTYYCEKCQR